jgi:hypothetical protein
MIISAILISTGCQEPPKDNLIPAAKRVQIQQTGDTVSKKLLQTLKQELLSAIKSGGPQNAISVCNTRALQLTTQLADSSDLPLNVKRVSSRYRNPANAPDEHELRALEHYRDQLENGDTTGYFIRPANISGIPHYDYYKPLFIQPLCLNCHGDPETISAAVSESIDQLYPGDRATGYDIGDFRGLIRVRIADEALNDEQLRSN